MSHSLIHVLTPFTLDFNIKATSTALLHFGDKTLYGTVFVNLVDYIIHNRFLNTLFNHKSNLFIYIFILKRNSKNWKNTEYWFS